MQDVLKPFLAACGIKSPKLASVSLAGIQKMLANDLVAQEDIPSIVQALGQVGHFTGPLCHDRLYDEGP